MLILFDRGTPAPLIPFLQGHTVTKAKDAGCDKLVNGELLKVAEEAGFEVLIDHRQEYGSAAEFEGAALRLWYSEIRNGGSCSVT